jgi:hypothetical protein
VCSYHFSASFSIDVTGLKLLILKVLRECGGIIDEIIGAATVVADAAEDTYETARDGVQAAYATAQQAVRNSTHT